MTDPDLLRRVLAGTTAMIAYWDRDLRCRFANDAYRTWFGVDPATLVGKHISELLGPTLYALNEPYMRAALRGEGQTFERLVPGPEGTSRHSLATYTPDVVDGAVVGFVAHVTEVTALKESEARLQMLLAQLQAEIGRRRSAEETLLEVERSLAVTLDAVGAGFLSTDEGGRVLRMNDVAERVTGWTQEEARGCSFWEVCLREDRPDWMLERSPIELMLENGTSLQTRQNLVMRSRHGVRTTVELQATLTRGEDGGVRGLALVFRDVTRLNAAEREARRLAALVGSSSDAIMAKTLDGIITDWNAAAERMFGYPASEAVGQHVRMLSPEDRRDEAARILEQVAAGAELPAFDAVRQTRDGRRIDVSLTVSPIRDALGNVVGASKIARDVTEQKRLTQELQRSNAELEQFAYVASHDLQEPLRMVINYTELLAQRYRGQLDDKADRYMHYATDGARRMQQLVADLLQFSRVGSQGKPLAPVDLGRVARSVVTSLRPLVEESGAVVDIEPMPRVLADEGQLRQLLQNLVTNAIKFRSEAPPRVTMTSTRRETFHAIAVRDNGIGLEMQYAERIFQMFQRLHEMGRYPGSGIGLAVAKRIVERHGGTIGVESRPGEGATFTFTLRAAD